MRIFIVMSSLMKRQVFLIIFSILMGLFTIMSNVGMLATSSVLISRAALHPDVLDLMVLIVSVRFFGISRGLLRYLERIFSHDTTFRILSSIRRWFYKSFNENYSENNNIFKTGDIYTKIVNDVDSLKEFYLRGLYPLIIAVLTGIVTTIYLSYFSVNICYLYIMFYIAAGFILPLILFKFNNRFLERESNLKREVNLLLIDTLKGSLEVYTYGLKDKYYERFIDLTRELSQIQRKKNVVNVLGDNMFAFTLSLLVVLTLLICGTEVINNKFLGIYYSMIPLSIMASFEALIPMPNIIYKFDEAYIAGKNIFSIMDCDSNSFEEKEMVPRDHNISVKNLTIWDASTETYIIKDISFELPYKKKVAIVGVSGSGKSTVLSAMLGFMKFEKGDIKIGDKSIKEINIEKLRELFTYVDQSPYIFNASLRENLIIANPQASESEIFRILERCEIVNLVNNLSKGLDSLLGQFGFNLSGGEKQRLIIARAILKKSEIVILDEPTASLDVKLEKKVIDFIHSEIKNKSCVWVTHRLIAMEWMDEIIVLHKGRVVERGTHSELLEKKGRYFRLWNIQNQYINS